MFSELQGFNPNGTEVDLANEIFSIVGNCALYLGPQGKVTRSKPIPDGELQHLHLHSHLPEAYRA